MKSKVDTGGYTLIWCATSSEMRDEVLGFLKENKQQFNKQLKVKLAYERVEEKKLVIRLSEVGSINGHKLLKQLIKQFATVVDASALSEKQWLMITDAKKPSEGGRLEKLFQSIRETFYVDVKHIYGPAPQVLRAQFKNRYFSIIDQEDKIFLIDEVGLNQRINLNCRACTSQHEFGCCCGSPCNYSSKNLKTYKAYEKAIIKEMKRIEPSFYEAVKKKRLEEGNGEVMLVDFDGTVGECEGRCMLLIREDGMAKCLAHKYALENQIPVYNVSPLSCLLFPLEVIECITDKGKRLYILTSVVEDEIASSVGRWGSYRSLELPLCCIDENLCNEAFKKEDYKTVLEENKGLISFTFGDALYEGLAYIFYQK